MLWLFLCVFLLRLRFDLFVTSSFNNWLWWDRNKGMFSLTFSGSSSLLIVNRLSTIIEPFFSQRILLKVKLFLTNFWNRACIKLTNKIYWSRWNYSKQFFLCDILLWESLMHLVEEYVVLNVSGIVSNTWFLLGHVTILPLFLTVIKLGFFTMWSSVQKF